MEWVGFQDSIKIFIKRKTNNKSTITEYDKWKKKFNLCLKKNCCREWVTCLDSAKLPKKHQQIYLVLLIDGDIVFLLESLFNSVIINNVISKI